MPGQQCHLQRAAAADLKFRQANNQLESGIDDYTKALALNVNNNWFQVIPEDKHARVEMQQQQKVTQEYVVIKKLSETRVE